MQELSKDVPKWKKSSVVEACALRKLGQVFTLEKGRTLDPSLFFGARACHSTSQSKSHRNLGRPTKSSTYYRDQNCVTTHLDVQK
jgi:hypothetical protein